MDQLLYLNLGAQEIIVMIILTLVPFILTVFCLLDIFRSTFQDPLNKVLWTIIVLLAPLLGPLAYLIWGRKQKAKPVNE